MEANMQSNIAGIAARGTWPKLADSEAITGSMESLFVVDISVYRVSEKKRCNSIQTVLKEKNPKTLM